MPTYEVTFTATVKLEAPNAAAAKAALMDDGGRLGVGCFRLIGASARTLRSPSGALKRDNDWWVTSEIGPGSFSNLRRVAPPQTS
jgi:hypothetical protein